MESENNKIIDRNQLSDEKAVGILFDAIRDVYVENNSYTNISDYSNSISLDELRELDPSGRYIQIYDEGEKILSITKPLPEPCPAPAPILDGWLEDGWNNYHNDYVGVIEVNALGETFDSYPLRTAAYSDWTKQRGIWVEKQLRYEKISNYFTEFSDLNDKFKVDYDSNELILGAGCVMLPQDNLNVYHPLLGQRVSVRFEDLVNNVISVYYENEPILLETNFLYKLFGVLKDINKEDLINTAHIKEIIAALDASEISLLDNDSLNKFLNAAIHSLSTKGEVLSDYTKRSKEQYGVLVDSSVVLICRKRADGLASFLEKIKNDINKHGNIPNHLLALIGRLESHRIEPSEPTTEKEKIAAIGGNYSDILLTKPSNREQLQIIRAIEKNDSVVVQGPPGTGKTHTIANLIGHFLANGKKILVVSEKTKALEVIQDQLEKDIRDLCVPILYGNTSKFDEAVNRIIQKNGQLSEESLEQKIKSIAQKRNGLIKSINDARERLYHLRNKQIEDIVYDNKTYSLIDIGKYLADNVEYASFIPDPIKRADVMPVTQTEILELLANNTAISKEEEAELSLPLPYINQLIPEKDIEDICDDKVAYDRRFADLEARFEGILDLDTVENTVKVNGKTVVLNPDLKAVVDLKKIIDKQLLLEDWLIEACLAERKGSGFYSVWKALVESVDKYISKANDYMVTKLTSDISFAGIYDLDEVTTALDECVKANKTENFGFLEKHFNSSVKAVINTVQINGKAAASYKDCVPALEYALLRKQELEVRKLWTQILVPLKIQNLPEVLDLGYLTSRCDEIKKALSWFRENLDTLAVHSYNAGFIGINYTYSDLQNKNDTFKEFYGKLIDDIRNYLEAVELMQLKQHMYYRIEPSLEILSEVSISSSVACSNIKSALAAYDAEAYKIAYVNYKNLLQKQDTYNGRNEFFQKLIPYAPNWANAIKNREGIYDATYLDVDFYKAWQWQQFNMIIKDTFADSEDTLVASIKENVSQLHALTVDLVCQKAWLANIKVCSKDAKIKRALNDSKIINRNIGLGKGKNVQLHLKQAKDNMMICQLAVPAWIMSVNDALQRFDPINNHFDVIIIDEASQSSSNVLALTYMADKLITVGDDKQVTPSAVGTNKNNGISLLEKHLKGIVDTYTKFCKDVSVYEVMSGVSVNRILLEHFRCMPAIIGFSNKYYYQNRIRPLRDVRTCNLDTNIINYRVDGHRDGDINEKEARNIVSLLKACLEQPEYKDKTFGIIPMQGAAQIELIRGLMRRYIGTKLEDDHNILCGDAASFQGDERDVLFMSLIDDNDTIRTIRTGANRGTYDQRYNVAVSRSKDQLWVVNSIDHLRLKTEDIRYHLLDYIDNYSLYLQQQSEIDRLSESPFENEVAKYLDFKGYNFKQQYAVGSYRIDIVVFYQDKRIAVECDGELYHSGQEKILEDMNREDILKRVGNWEFIRIRGGAYYKNKQQTMEWLEKQLNEHGIFPSNEKNADVKPENDELLQKIKARSQELLDTWEKEDDGNIILTSPVRTRATTPRGAGYTVSHPVTKITEPARNPGSGKKPVNSIPKGIKNPSQTCDMPSLFENINTVNQGKPDAVKLSDIEPIMVKDEPLEVKNEGNCGIKLQSVDELKTYLEREGYEIVDNRGKNGPLWVIGASNLNKIFEKVTSLKLKFKEGGTKATGHRDAWWIK